MQSRDANFSGRLCGGEGTPNDTKDTKGELVGFGGSVGSRAIGLHRAGFVGESGKGKTQNEAQRTKNNGLSKVYGPKSKVFSERSLSES